MWSEQNAENYMKYFDPLTFKIKSDYLGNNELRDAVNQFKDGYAQGEIDTSQYMKIPKGIWRIY